MDQIQAWLMSLGPWGVLLGVAIPYILGRLGIKIPNVRPTPTPDPVPVDPQPTPGPVDPVPQPGPTPTPRPLLDMLLALLRNLLQRREAGEVLTAEETEMIRVVGDVAAKK